MVSCRDTVYQALAEDERRAGLFRDFRRTFSISSSSMNAHRGSARDDSSWRVILEHFEPSYQRGMTAMPLREENRDTYLYFGNPIYEYDWVHSHPQVRSPSNR